MPRVLHRGASAPTLPTTPIATVEIDGEYAQFGDDEDATFLAQRSVSGDGSLLDRTDSNNYAYMPPTPGYYGIRVTVEWNYDFGDSPTAGDAVNIIADISDEIYTIIPDDRPPGPPGTLVQTIVPTTTTFSCDFTFYAMFGAGEALLLWQASDGVSDNRRAYPLAFTGLTILA
jgi:hypothetical protein